MVDVVGIGLVFVGLIVLFAGAALSIYGVAILGAGIGGGLGFVLAPTLGLGSAIGTLIAVAVGIVAGLVITYMLLSVAIAGLGFVVGGYIGLVLLSAVLGPGAGILSVVGFFIGGVVGAGLAPFVTRTLLVVVTAFIGAALVSGSLTMQDFVTVQEELTIDPLLVDPGSIVLIGLFALGVLVQLGLFRFGHVRRLVAILPGASVLRDRVGRSDSDQKQG
ncbi:MAG: phosphate ABC transporter permease [Salinirussus sp.]